MKFCTNLDTVLEAVQLQFHHVSTYLLRQPYFLLCPMYSIPLRALAISRLTSQQLFAIWQPAWPTIRVQSQHKLHVSRPRGQGGRGGQGALGPWARGKQRRTVERDDFTHSCDLPV
jgi:hypothetical protein